MDQQIVELNQKLDLLNVQVAYLTEQAQITERQKQDRAELIRDLTPIANEAFRLSVVQLEEIQDYIDLGDLLRLFKRVMRNGRNFEKILDQLESLADLAETLSPIADDAFSKTVDTLSGLEQKGYFGFARSSARVIDNLVTSFTGQDVERFGDAVVPILKEATKPEVLNFIQTTLIAAGRDLQKPADSSLLGLVRQMSNPAVRRGMAMTLSILHAIGDQAPRFANNTQKTNGAGE
jgi:uncharacterized protein YjgD (DUF1641 family)